MNEMVSLRVGAAIEAPVCIIDGSLALSPMGLILALRLARCRRVWLVRALWSLLDNDEFYQERPELIGGPESGTIQAQMLSEWRRAWLQANLLDRFNWIGDARHESLLPEDIDEGAVERFELLTQLFDARANLQTTDILTPLSECARDAVVLSAVLGTQCPVILTAPGKGKSPPDLCDVLSDAGVTCKRLRDNAKPSGLNDDIFPSRAWFATRQMAMFGFRLAAVHLVAPRAVVIGSRDPSQSWSGDEPLDFDPWADACAVWHTF